MVAFYIDRQCGICLECNQQFDGRVKYKPEMISSTEHLSGEEFAPMCHPCYLRYADLCRKEW